jgi:ubiquinone/menaquinone biosynthesis C-methylase UbiE
MSPGLVSVLIVLVIVAGVWALGRVRIPRKAGLEGVEDAQVAAAYDQISGWPQFSYLRSMVLSRLGRIRPEGTLADIGCGPGYLAALMARRFARLHVIGIDMSEEMLEAGARKVSSLGLQGRLEFRQGTVERLPLLNNSLNFAVSTLSLHHWVHPLVGLEEIYRVLRPGGRLLLFDLRRDPMRIFFWLLRFGQARVVPEPLRRVGEPLGSIQASYTPSEIQDLLRQTPFGKGRIEEGMGWVFVWATKD